MRTKRLLIATAAAAAILGVSSCSTPQNISYFQDFSNNPDTVINLQNRVITLKPADKLYIGVKSKDPQISQLFNLTGGITSGSTTNISKDAYYYTVDTKGCIDFPVLGELKVEGLTREQVATLVKKKLMENSLVKDPTVTVGLSNLHYSILGEVSKPGQYAIEEEKVTLLDAISKAGDLTIQGRRQDVMVLRKEGNQQRIFKVNLCSGRDIFSSPAYFLQQNDVVYVTPNDTKKRSSTLNGNTVQSTGFWMSVASLLMSVLTFLKIN